MLYRELNRICVMLKPYYTIIGKVALVSVFVLMYFACMPAIANVESSYQSATKTEVITVPDGQVLHAIVTTPLDTKYITSGQTISATLERDFCYNSKMIATVDSMIYGTVISVSRSQKGKPAEILLRFNQLITPYGLQIPITAIVKTKDKSGKLTGDTTSYSDENGNIDIPVAASIDLILTQPITVNPEVYSSNY